MNRYSTTSTLVFIAYLAVMPGVRPANAQNYLYPDLFPYVEANALASFQTLQAWQLTDYYTIQFSTMFANQGDGLFEIRRGPNVSPSRYEVLQRVYINNDFGPQYEDFSIGTAPIPGTAGTPNPSDLNLIWFESFTKFSLLEAPVVNGLVTVGNEVSSTLKTSWRLSSNTGPLPGYAPDTPVYESNNQSLQQRVSVGWADMYDAGPRGQYLGIYGVPVGPKYWLRQTVDPDNRIHETDETNNSFEVLIDLAAPGQAIKTLNGQFVQPGDRLRPGDLNEDGLIDINDWLAFKAGAETSLDGLGDADAYALGDLNLDGKHSVDDAALFQQYFDDHYGAGAFARIQGVPEPSTLLLGGAATLLLLTWCGVGRRRVRRKLLCSILLLAAGWVTPRGAVANVTLFYENFDGLTLGPNVDDTPAFDYGWTDTPPIGWVVDDSGMPFLADNTRGVTEWEGWSFANKEWWVAVAGDQKRSQFTLGRGTVAVADPDEWEDKGNPINGPSFAGYYNALFKSPAISLADIAAGTARLAFSSSWRDGCCDDGPSDTNNQTARIRVSYDNGASFSEVMRWESNAASPFFKDDATNETVVVDLNNPAGATNAIVEFGLLNAGNDWWWAIDNVEVFTPSVLEVNTTTGKMTILGVSQITGYEITSAEGSLNPAGWKMGNLDAQNFGPTVPLSADFNNTNSVDAADYTLWRNSVGPGAGADANGDGVTDQADYAVWRQQFGKSLAAGESWETLIGTNKQLLEFYLSGSSTFASRSIGFGYDTAIDARNLTFKYSTANGQKFVGLVQYVSGGGAASSLVPEPSSLLLIVLGMAMALGSQSRKRFGQLRLERHPLDH